MWLLQFSVFIFCVFFLYSRCFTFFHVWFLFPLFPCCRCSCLILFVRFCSISLEVHATASPSFGYFGLLSVQPSLQKRGLGKRMVCSAEEYFHLLGLQEVHINCVNIRTELVGPSGFYPRLGYSLTGETGEVRCVGCFALPCFSLLSLYSLSLFGFRCDSFSHSIISCFCL